MGRLANGTRLWRSHLRYAAVTFLSSWSNGQDVQLPGYNLIEFTNLAVLNDGKIFCIILVFGNHSDKSND
jgi:hypothetical protein